MNTPWRFADHLPRRRLLQAGGASALVTATVGCDLLSTDPGADESQSGGDPDALESPMLTEKVDAGELPPLEDRLPPKPLVVEPVDQPGVFGGEWRTAMLGPADSAWLLRTVGYDQLMRWNLDFTEPLPNLAEDVEVNDDGREYIIHLRPGIKWSDGEPFSADDIVFAYNDILIHDELPNSGVPPTWLTSGGGPAEFEKADDLTVVVRFTEPHGLFLNYLASPDGNTLTAWAKHHYGRFHIDHNPEAEQLAEEAGASSWVELFTMHAGDDLGGLTNSEPYEHPDAPTLRPWMVVRPLEAGSLLGMERNPYYWKTDPDGRQLPYIDQVTLEIINDEEVLLLKTGDGEFDMHERHINNLANKPVLAQNREEANIEFFDVVESSMNHMVIAFNLACEDPNKREIFNNRDFRIGLSHAINRDELIDAVFQRQGEAWQLAPREENEDYYDEEMAKQYTAYDVDLANDYLDQAGFAERDSDDLRLGPDGEPISFGVDIALGLSPFWVDAMEMIRGYWREVGIDMRLNSIDRDLFYDRKEANEHDAGVWTGDGGLADCVMDPRWYLPYSDESVWAIPWANWYNDQTGTSQEPPDAVKQQFELYDQFRAEVDEAEQVRLFKQILHIAKEQFWAIGTVLPVGGYGIMKTNFHNVPSTMPGAWIYPHPAPSNPEQFFISG